MSEDRRKGVTDRSRRCEAARAETLARVTRVTMTKRSMRTRRAKTGHQESNHLINLDLDSAYYDVKTRSVRGAPDKTVEPEEVCRVQYLH